MRNLFLIAIFLFFTAQAHALSGSVCAKGSGLGGDAIGFVSNDVGVIEAVPEFVRPGMCSTIQPARTGLKVVKIGLGIATIASLCGVGTAPLSIGLGIATATVEVIDATAAVVCDTGEPTKEELAAFLCAQLKAQGLHCDPNVQFLVKP